MAHNLSDGSTWTLNGIWSNIYQIRCHIPNNDHETWWVPLETKWNVFYKLGQDYELATPSERKERLVQIRVAKVEVMKALVPVPDCKYRNWFWHGMTRFIKMMQAYHDEHEEKEKKAKAVVPDRSVAHHRHNDKNKGHANDLSRSQHERQQQPKTEAKKKREKSHSGVLGFLGV